MSEKCKVFFHSLARSLAGPPAPVRAKNRRLVEFLIPGPLTLIRYLLFVPVWPMIVVYAEALPFWPLKSVISYLPISSGAPLWVWPLDWLRVQAPTFNFDGIVIGRIVDIFSSTSLASVVVWLIVPHLLWTMASVLLWTLWMLVFGTANSCAAYFNRVTASEGRKRSWGFYFTLQDNLTLRDRTAAEDYAFHRWLARLQSMLGLALTGEMSTVMWLPLVSIMVVMSATIASVFEFEDNGGVCMEQELLFLYAHVSWWAIVCVGHHARRRNVFFREPSVLSRRA